MLDLHRLRLLRELSERGTIAAVAEALRFTPSAVSQQLAVLEREAGVELLVRSGRSVRLTDAARVLVGHAEVLLDRVRLAEAELAGAAGTPGGRMRLASFQSGARQIALPAMQALAQSAPALRVELTEGEPEATLPALVLGDVDVVLADEWRLQPVARPAGIARIDLQRDPVLVVLPAGHPVLAAHDGAIPLADLAGAVWTTGPAHTAWAEEMTRTCRDLAGFDPDIRHRAADIATNLAIVGHGQALTLLPQLAEPGAHPGVVARPIAGRRVYRTIFLASRTADAERPSTQTTLTALQAAAEALAA